MAYEEKDKFISMGRDSKLTDNGSINLDEWQGLVEERLLNVGGLPTEDIENIKKIPDIQSSLDDIETKKANKDELVLKRDKNESIYLADLSTEVKTSMTGGSVAVVGKNIIGAENIKKLGIDADKLDFISITSVNLFNKKIIETGSLTSNGTVNTTANTYYTSDFIPVPANTVISFVSCGGYRCEYDVNKTLIRANIIDVRFTTSANTAFIRTSMTLADKDVALVCIGTAPSSYQSYYDKIEFNSNVKIKKENMLDYEISKNKCDFFTPYSKSKNVLNPKLAKIGYYVTNDTISPMANYTAFVGVLVKPNTTYKSNRQNGYYAIFDKNGIRLSADNASSNTFNIPSNGYSLNFTVYSKDSTPNDIMLVEGLEVPETIIPYEEDTKIDSKIDADNVLGLGSISKLDNKKWAVLGDSISDKGFNPNNPKQTMKYYDYIKEKTKNLEIYMHGKSMTTISKKSDRTDSMLERYVSMPSDADIITVFGGTNDFGFSIPLGDISSTDEFTFYGALKSLITGLMVKYKGKKIGFITPLRRTNAVTNDIDEAKLKSYVNAIIEVCEYYSIPYLDLYRKSGLYPQIEDIKINYMSDGLHPDNDGHKYYLADKIQTFIESL